MNLNVTIAVLMLLAVIMLTMLHMTRLGCILCEKCVGKGTVENEGVTNNCPVCDGEPIITFATVAEYARQIDELRKEALEVLRGKSIAMNQLAVAETQIDEARSHLGAALVQTDSRTLPTILGHVREAFKALGGRV